MKTNFFRRIVTGALLIGALTISDKTACAAGNADLSSRIYGAGKATLRFPGDGDDAAGAYYKGHYVYDFYGTVAQVRGRDYFDFRADDSRCYRVVGKDNDDHFNVSTGQRVVVRGYLTQDIIVAYRVRDLGGYGYRDVDFPATVTAVNSTYRLTVRADNGRSYTIDARYRLTNTISVGDYVRIIGSWNGSTVTAEQVIILRDDYEGGYGDQVDFPATVTSIDRYRNAFTVRGDNDVTYTVTYTGADRFDLWDKVRIVGTFDGVAVRATSITRR